MPQNNKFIIAIIFFIILIDMLGLGILIPLVPVLMLPSSMSNVMPHSWDLGQIFIYLGWLTAIFPFGQFIFTPLLGQLSDIYGRKKIIQLSTLGTILGYILFVFGISTKMIWIMLAARFITGGFGGNLSVCQTIIADISKPQDRAKNFGIIGAAFGSGFIIGPLLGGKLSDANFVSWFNVNTPFYFMMVISILSFIMTTMILPETLQIKSTKPIEWNRPLHNIMASFKIVGLRTIVPTTFFFYAGFTFFTTFFAIMLAKKYFFSQVAIGNYFAYLGIAIVLAQGMVVRRLSGHVADYKVLRVSIFMTAIGVLIYYFIPIEHMSLLFWVIPLLAISNAATNSFMPAIVARITPITSRGESMGVNSSIRSLAYAIPAVLSGYAANIHPDLPIVLGSFIIFIGSICFWLMFKPQNFSHQV